MIIALMPLAQLTRNVTLTVKGLAENRYDEFWQLVRAYSTHEPAEGREDEEEGETV